VLRDLIHHLGGVHRWATGFIRGEGGPEGGDLEVLSGGWPTDAELVAWFREGCGALADALTSAPTDLDAWTFLPAPTPLLHWARRQAHETAIHRVDAEHAANNVTGFPAGFAADGIDEIVIAFVGRGGAPVEGDAPSMLVAPSDDPTRWGVTFESSGLRTRADPDADRADLALRGAASDLYLTLWNRRTAEGSELEGDASLLDRWREAVDLRWS
jgi:uncharacterized protein (TIGR03083 family)